MMTVKAVSQRLSLSLAKVYALVQSGQIECYRFGRSVRISEEQLTAYLEQVKSRITRFEPSTSRHF